MHGIGICWYANGDKYYGQWRAGMRHGMGRMEWCDRHIYEGTWRQDIVCPGLKSKRMSKENLGRSATCVRSGAPARSPWAASCRVLISLTKRVARAASSRSRSGNASAGRL